MIIPMIATHFIGEVNLSKVKYIKGAEMEFLSKVVILTITPFWNGRTARFYVAAKLFS